MVDIEEYQDSDLIELIELFRDTVHNINAKDYNKIQLDTWAPKKIDKDKWEKRLKSNYSIIAKNDRQIVGFGELTKAGHIDMLYVHKDHQGQNIGRDIIERLTDKAKEIGIQELTTDASITARPFFEKQGFKAIAQQTPIRNGIEFINFKMTKKIKGSS